MSNDNEWLEIQYIGKHKRPVQSLKPVHEEDAQWVYTPSGRIGAYMTDMSKFCMIHQICNKHYVFTFVDLVSKVSFEMKLETENDWANALDKPRFVNFYFLTEDVMVIVESNKLLVTQLVYEIDHINQSLQLKETIVYQLVKRVSASDRYFSKQPARFTRLEGIDYLVVIGGGEEIRLVGEVLGSDFATILMIPKYPSQTVAAKEFHVHDEKKQYEYVERRVRQIIANDSQQYDEFLFVPEFNSCTISETKLWICIEAVAWREFDLDTNLGTLMGVYLTIDLTKLKEVTNKQITTRQEYDKLKEEQADAYELLVDDVLYLADKTYFWQYVNDIDFLNVFRKNEDYAENTSMALFYPSSKGNPKKPIVLGADMFQEYDKVWKSCYTLHPYGALLNFILGPNMLIYVRVMKCLRFNLKSLALNKGLFHKDTPIRYHIAYRLCFNGEKPIEYKDNNDVQQALKQF